MKTLLLPFGFEWDKHNTQHIKTKHDLEPSECEEVFVNLPLTVKDDTTHSQSEQRYRAIGKTNTGRILIVIFTIRNKKIRIITSRDANKKEKKESSL